MADENEKISASLRVTTSLELTLLGTGTSQGIPVIGCTCQVCTSKDSRNQRLRTAAFVKAGSVGIAIDVGPDFRMQMLQNRISDVHAVLLTHEHNDHVSGLDDIRPINFKYHRDIPLYGNERTLQEIQRRFYYAFDDDYAYSGKPRVHPVPVTDNAFLVEGITVQPIPVQHGDLEILGYRIGGMGYITDAKSISESSKTLLQGLDVLILNALRNTTHPTHLTVAEAIRIFEELQPARCYLTHVSHEMGLHEEIDRSLPPGVHLGYDNLVLHVE